MRRAVLAVALLLAAATPAGAAPRAVDFERAAPGKSARVRAPERFDLVGLRWAAGQRVPHVQVRARRNGGSFGRWHELAADGRASDPLWTGGADVVEYRLSHRVRGLRLHFVRAPRFRAPAAPHRAAASRPAIYRRSAWSGRSCRPRERRALGEVNAAIVHHTVTSTAYAPDDVPAMILSICRYHRDSLGWNDIGYNFLVDRFGRLWEGRAGGLAKAVIGAHAGGFNAQTTGISNLGTFTSSGQTDAGLRAMAKLIRWKLPLHGEPTTGRTRITNSSGGSVRIDRISGHRDVNATSCPGDALHAQLPELRERVGAAEPAPAGPPVELFVDQPDPYVRRGRLLELTGTISPRKDFLTVVLDKRRDDGRWRPYRRIPGSVTGGAFSEHMRLRNAGLYRVYARFDGDGENGPGKSLVYRVRVPTEWPPQEPPPG